MTRGTPTFAALVATSDEVAATSARSAKIASIARLLADLPDDEVGVAVALLSGEPRQGRIGIGWATVADVAVDAAAEPRLSITDVDAVLDELRGTTGPGSVERRRALLGAMFASATSTEIDFLRRLFTGELRQGALEGVVAEAVAKATGVAASDVRRAVMLDGDLPRVAELAATGGTAAVRAVGFKLFRPVRPMLASTAADVADAMDDAAEVSVEWKLDGIRVQVHRSGDDVRLYTRNLNDVTDRLPDVAAAVATLPLDRAVFDGEAIALGDDERPWAFQDTMGAVGRRSVPASGVVAFLFDCLHLDGADLVDEPLRARLGHLEEVAPTMRVPGVVTTDRNEAEQVLADALTAGHEGVVVKDAASAYVAGRRGKAWRKVKPVRTLDLVVLGAEWGHGRRRGRLSNLHLGARGPDGGFVMVGKTFKGLTDEVLEWQTAELLARETQRRGIAVFVRPELVVEIALDGVQSSTRYAGGVALRFARVRRYRPDKSPGEADTIETVRAMLSRHTAP